MADNNPVKGGYTYTFVGAHAPEAKASIGDKNDQNKWPILWEAGDKLGVYDADGTLVGAAELAAESAGQNQGTFTVTANREFTEGEALTLKYPYSEGEAFVPTKQTQLAVSSSAGLGANAVASATTTFAAEGTTFSLSHANAYVRFELTSEEFKDYTLNGVTLWCKGENLSGAADAQQDYVKATLSEPVVLGTETKYIWMTANNVNLTDKDFYAIVHMTKGKETVTLPISLKGKGELKAHAVTSLKLPKLVKSLAPAWYEPIETRYIAAYGEGWCYGPENTVVFTGYKTTDVQTVDVKARGNFMKVTEPKKVRVKYLNGLNDCTSPLGVYVDGTCITTYAAGKDAETFSIAPIGSTYTISVSVDNHKYLGAELGAAGYISAMEVLDASDNVIWGINLWLRLKALGEIQYNNGVIMDRNLGVDELGNANTWRASGNYFQWGRPFAIQSQSSDYTKKHFTKAEAVAVTSLDVSAANPFTLYYYAAKAGYNDWYYGDGTTSRENDLDDLWGNPGGGWNSKGVKSIYDPCPDGWMVASPAILNELIQALGTEELTFTTGTYPYLTYKGAVWGYAGGYTCDGYNSGMNWKTIGQLFAYWSNASTPDSGYARNIYSATYNSIPTKFDNNFSKARAFPIRCMKDTENR